MGLNRNEVEKIAHLARLAVSEEQLESYVTDLSRILDLVAEMNTADTTDVAPMAHPLDATQRLRTDEVTESDQRALFQDGAPEVEAGLYIVPKVIE
ncbi:MAG: Asp-tRNA(Asn)/Glu-tRNA(Gln) amidotransferase GatCAB subunit C [Gammaproteobacteria bacterium]|nr:MAG: Asp-tRNA(Asn)/Glu-tRNA(Gln) amidotransferase GatCAB subunit C [Gammaproteobacteria bacterium]